jgi:hypothetical protein
MRLSITAFPVTPSNRSAKVKLKERARLNICICEACSPSATRNAAAREAGLAVTVAHHRPGFQSPAVASHLVMGYGQTRFRSLSAGEFQ